MGHNIWPSMRDYLGSFVSNNFLIIGHGGSGTSLLRGLLNAHSQITCGFEIIGEWEKNAAECKTPIWGNKQPLERLWGAHKLKDDEIIEFIDDYLIIWIVRRFEKWIKNQKPHHAEANWQRGRAIYWAMRNRRPERIIEVSFEDLLLRTVDELWRICNFLHVSYEQRMLRTGTAQTGHKSFNYGRILTEKV